MQGNCNRGPQELLHKGLQEGDCGPDFGKKKAFSQGLFELSVVWLGSYALNLFSIRSFTYFSTTYLTTQIFKI